MTLSALLLLSVACNIEEIDLHCDICKDCIFSTMQAEDRALIFNMNPPQIVLRARDFWYHPYQQSVSQSRLQSVDVHSRWEGKGPL